MRVGVHRRIVAAVCGAAALCASCITAGTAHADGELTSVTKCGDSLTSWANRWAVYSGARFVEDDVSVGLQTELTILKERNDASPSYILNVAAVEANWGWDPAHAADSTFYDKTELTPNTVSNDGTWTAVAVGHYKKFGEHTTKATFTITPHCAADGSVDTLSLRQDDSPGPVWTAELTRREMTPV